MSNRKRPIKVISTVVPISRELALDYGLVQPTDAERAEALERSRLWRLRTLQAWAVYDLMRPALADLRDPVSRAVLDLHEPDENGVEYAGRCTECHDGGEMGDRLEWPCATVRAVASVHGIETPGLDLWRRPEESA